MAKHLVDFHEVSDDKRGRIFEIERLADFHMNVLTLNKGLARGGHSHDYPEEFLLVSGKVEYYSGIVGKASKTAHEAISIIRTTPNEPHYMQALADSILIEFRPNGTSYKPANYEPFREIVTKLMEEV